ncbi:Multicopper oxidase, type 1 [Dillenia turbinata]|uniref:Multicopper oxidase, type 1 n=1 Tax=Dillenia turbinata TaxID=194707 RepID=A0AAN8V340_9MAGN
MVEADGEYTKPFKTSYLMLTPGQTYNQSKSVHWKIHGNVPLQSCAKSVSFLEKTSFAIRNYKSFCSNSLAM